MIHPENKAKSPQLKAWVHFFYISPEKNPYKIMENAFYFT